MAIYKGRKTLQSNGDYLVELLKDGNVEVDMAVIRISPQLGESAVNSLSPNGEFELDIFKVTITKVETYEENLINCNRI